MSNYQDLGQPNPTNKILKCILCDFATFNVQRLRDHYTLHHHYLSADRTEPDPKESSNKLPPNQGKRDKIRPRHDLIPLAFLDELASIFEEGRAPRPGFPEGYGDSWKIGGEDFLRDCLNHASNHLHLYMEGDRNENHLSKVAWNVLCIRWHALRKENQNNSDPLMDTMKEIREEIKKEINKSEHTTEL